MYKLFPLIYKSVNCVYVYIVNNIQSGPCSCSSHPLYAAHLPSYSHIPKLENRTVTQIQKYLLALFKNKPTFAATKFFNKLPERKLKIFIPVLVPPPSPAHQAVTRLSCLRLVGSRLYLYLT